MAKDLHTPRDDRTRPMSALPDPDAVPPAAVDDDDKTRPMSALPDPEEPSGSQRAVEATQQLHGLAEGDESVDPAADTDTTRQMKGLSDLLAQQRRSKD